MTFSRLFAGFFLITLGAASALAQEFPSRPIKFVVGFAPGGGTDLVARILGAKMAESLGQPVVVDNKPGAAGQIGTAFTAKQPADGYTILMVSTPATIHPSLHRNLPYDILADLAPVSLMVLQPLALVVNPSLPAQSVKELIALAKAQPGKLNYSSGGSGTGTHLAGELLKSLTGIDVVHVPYNGQAAALTAVLAGQVTFAFDQPGTSMGHVNAGKLRMLAVTTRARFPQLPNTPTVDEAGVPGYQVDSWFGVLAPAKTPKPIVDRLSAEVARAVKAPDVQEKLAAQGFVPVGGTPEQFGAFLSAEVAKWKRVVEVSGAKAD